MLDAAARILDRDGWDALTTTAAAREAGCSVGAVYDYFPNQRAILEALLARYELRLAERLAPALAELPDRPLAACDGAVDALAAMWSSEPGYRAAWLGTRLEAEVAAAGQQWSARFVERIADALAGSSPALPPAERRIVATIAVHLVSGLLLAVVTGPPEQLEPGIAETRIALRAYLQARLGIAPAPADRADPS